MNQIYMRNRRRAQKFDPNIKKSVNMTKKIEKLRLNKDKIIQALRKRLQKKNDKKKPQETKQTAKKKAPPKKK